MKVLKFFIGLAAAYVALCVVWAGLNAVWDICMGLTGVAGILLALFIFCILPGLLVAWFVFKW